MRSRLSLSRCEGESGLSLSRCEGEGGLSLSRCKGEKSVWRPYCIQQGRWTCCQADSSQHCHFLMMMWQWLLVVRVGYEDGSSSIWTVQCFCTFCKGGLLSVSGIIGEFLKVRGCNVYYYGFEGIPTFQLVVSSMAVLCVLLPWRSAQYWFE